MRLKHFSTLLVVVGMILTGCGGGGGSTGTDPIIPPTDIDLNVTITADYQVESLGTANTINASVSLGNTPKDLYLVLSNNALISASATIAHNAKVAAVAQSKTILSTDLIEKPTILHAPQYVQDFPSRIGAVLTQNETTKSYEKIITTIERQEDAVGTGQIFYLSEDTSESTFATARYVETNNTVFGNKTLNIWVSNDSFDKEDGSKDCNKSKCVTQDMVNALAETFLLSGSDNDIYDWVTNIYGEEWSNAAQAKNSSLIAENDEITILLTDISNDDSPNGGIIGFFYAKDNYISGIYNNGTYDLRGSNERVMFYIDSVMFANGGNPWSIDDPWPKETVSTLAHEFQHMIDFYQKNVLLDANALTWIKEMLSESTEDIIATKIGHSVEGRYPLFNANNTLSLTSWNNQLEDYSKVNVFGAYLLRNYGGAKLLHDIMHNSFEDEQAVVDAVNKSTDGSGKVFADLLSEWGVAVMLSDHDNLVDAPVYNIGTLFEDVYESTTYYMRSINLFNYIPQPETSITSGTIQPQGNYYYLIGDNLTDDINITLELNGQTEATLIAK
jgi:hypothetical protein